MKEVVCSYGEQFPLKENAVLVFPDFRLEYKGQHSKTLKPADSTLKHNFTKFLYRDFEIETPDGKTNKYSFTGGTGLLIPVKLTIGGKAYLFEWWKAIITPDSDDPMPVHKA